MSQRQEQLKARMWEEVHKAQHDQSIAEIQQLKAQMDTLPEDSAEYAAIKKEHDQKYAAAEAFFMQFFES